MQFHDIILQSSGGNATLRCETYRLGSSANNYVGEFCVIGTTFDNSEFSIPSNRVATFQEELRSTSKASSVITKKREEINQGIKDKMSEAYGESCIVDIKILNSDKN